MKNLYSITTSLTEYKMNQKASLEGIDHDYIDFKSPENLLTI